MPTSWRWRTAARLRHELVSQGIAVGERVAIPDDLIPADARVEMDAKKAAGYFSADHPDADRLAVAHGRPFEA